MDGMDEALREYVEAINHAGCGGSQNLIDRIMKAVANGDDRVTIRDEKPHTKLSNEELDEQIWRLKNGIPTWPGWRNEDDPPSE